MIWYQKHDYIHLSSSLIVGCCGHWVKKANYSCFLHLITVNWAEVVLPKMDSKVDFNMSIEMMNLLLEVSHQTVK